jgi:hypothetical protein
MEARLEFDLREVENTIEASLIVFRTTEEERQQGYPDGVTLWADRRYHGAELHLTWAQAEQLRDYLHQLVKDALLR